MKPRFSGFVVLLLLVTLSQTGCVQRRITVRSNPPGALVYVDGYEVGATPVSTSFIYYGTREIRLVKDGYETLTVKQPIPPPWYQIFPLEFVTDNLVPGEIRDERVVEYQMTPQVLTNQEQLLGRAQGLRAGSQFASQAGAIAPFSQAPLPTQQQVVPYEQIAPPAAQPVLPPAASGPLPPPNVAPPGYFPANR